MKSIGLFLIIFFAVFLANVASHIFTTALVVAGVDQLFQSFKAEAPAVTQQYSEGLARDIARLNAQKLTVEVPEISVRTKEQQRAFENDTRLCKYWRQTYLKDGDETAKMHMESACKRAAGG